MMVSNPELDFVLILYYIVYQQQREVPMSKKKEWVRVLISGESADAAIKGLITVLNAVGVGQGAVEIILRGLVEGEYIFDFIVYIDADQRKKLDTQKVKVQTYN